MSQKVVNLKLGEPYDVYIGRAVPRRGLKASKWANPYKVGKCPRFSRDEALHLYQVNLQYNDPLIDALPELKGKTLGCWCGPPGGLTADDKLICHGQILLKMLAALEKGECGE